MSDKRFETESGESLTKPIYFFGDSIKENEDFMSVGEERWLCMIDNIHIFLPGMSESYGLTYL